MLGALPPEALVALAGFLGMLIGSFLNVVIYRLPKMMEQQWASECAELSGNKPVVASETFNLMAPRSRCSNCGHALAWHENIPLVSYIFLRGKCSVCDTPYGLRYPAVEIVTGLLFSFCVWRWGGTVTALVWCGFSAALLTLALIDWDTTLLPDDITLPLLWAGLVVAALQLNASVTLPDALWGAVAGYLSLWLVYWAFKLVTGSGSPYWPWTAEHWVARAASGKDGMGYGDFKLFAALGAWFGWTALVPVILMASVIGAVVGIAMKFSGGLREGGYVPFGPFLAGAGFTAMIFGPQSILRFVGL